MAPQTLALRSRNADDTEHFWCSQAAGVDQVTTVPLSRWDHNAYYVDHPESWKMTKVNVNHTSLIDGITCGVSFREVL